MKYRVGTRDSKLAIIQAELVCNTLIKVNPSLSIDQFQLIKIKTKGDKILDKDLSAIGGKNLFVKEIEEALLTNEIDFAVHSLKDMTANLDPKLTIAACLEREDPRDALVSVKYKDFLSLPQAALIGTSSVRRKAIALSYRPDLITTSFRGNVLTRIDKLKNNQVDATFLAVAGLKRLNIETSLYQALPIDNFLPAISQGVIGVECHKSNNRILSLLQSINHQETSIITLAERGFLETLNADCNMPIAAYAIIDKETIKLKSLVVDQNNIIHKSSIRGSLEEAYKLGSEAGLSLKGFLPS